MKNLMVVDDEPAQLKSLRVGLRSRGYRVREASNAVEALDFIEKEPNRVDLVITDYCMPSTDGLEFFEKLKTINRCLPLMMMTAYGEKDLILKALRSGCAGFIEKPFSLDELVEEIQRIEKNGLGKKPTPAESLDLAELVHQIKNPLMMIMGNAELTLLKEENSEVRKRMDGIMKAAEIIQKLNSQILNKERSGFDTAEPVDVCERMRVCTRMFENIMALRGIHLEEAYSVEPLRITGSRFGLDQVFRNLILNAIEAMETGNRKKLSIRIERTECVHIRIEDTGPGIPEESMETIFSPFFSTKRNGTGLGLHIVRGIVNNHGGALSVQSKLGSGTVFHVRLPESINCKCKQECID